MFLDKPLFSLFIIIALSGLVPVFQSNLCAQAIDYSHSAETQSEQSNNNSSDTLIPKFSPEFEKVMIVPFDMTYYLSDADHELARINKKTLREVQQAFRYGLDMTMSAVVEEIYSTKRILLDTVPEANQDLRKLYGAVSWRYSKAKVLGGIASKDGDDRVSATTEDNSFGSRLRKAFNVDPDPLAENGGDSDFSSGIVRGPIEGQRMMHAHLLAPEVLLEMYDIYGTDLFLFINQFELKTNFEHCLDRATSNYVREASVHYSLYDLNGNLIDANVFTVVFDSKSRKLEDIISENFPQLCTQAARGLPKPKMVKSESGN
ncbi:MAG: hypothetical protein ACI959_001721 [Limisphaerales bacterium]|jgi:hypothetical protein